MPRKKVKIAIPKLKEHADKVLSDLGHYYTSVEFVEEYKKQYPD